MQRTKKITRKLHSLAVRSAFDPAPSSSDSDVEEAVEQLVSSTDTLRVEATRAELASGTPKEPFELEADGEIWAFSNRDDEDTLKIMCRP